MRLLAYLLSPILLILYLTLYLPLALILKILDRLLLLLRMPNKKIKPVSVIKKVKVPEQEINDLLDPESDLLSTLLDDALIRESIISHLEICYNYQIKQANEDY